MPAERCCSSAARSPCVPSRMSCPTFASSWLSGPKPTANTSVTYDPSAAGDGTADNPSLSIGSNPPRADRLPLPSLAEVLRLDVTVEWVLQRWPRSDHRPAAIAVAGLSGAVGQRREGDGRGRLADLLLQRPAAGAANHASRHDGRSESSGRSLTSRYGFTRRLTNDPGLVLYEAVDSSNRSIGSFKIRSAPVVSMSQPYSRFQIDLVMERAE